MGKEIGSFIRQQRERKGLSQGDVARKLRLKTAQSISNIERGVSPLPRTKIKRLADVLGVKKSEIVTVVLKEVHDRYSKAAGVALPAPVQGLSRDERGLLDTLADRLRSAGYQERAVLRQRVRRALKGNA